MDLSEYLHFDQIMSYLIPHLTIPVMHTHFFLIVQIGMAFTINRNIINTGMTNCVVNKK